MNIRLVRISGLVISGALLGAEFLDGKAHADYNVPAPTVAVVNAVPVSNTAAQITTGPANYQTMAHTNVFLSVKG